MVKLEKPDLPSLVSGYLPILTWLPAYQRAMLRPDIIAGLTMWAVLVPEAMAYATLAGVPPEAGLYAALAGLLVYPLFASSRRATVGPSSAVAAIAAATVAPFAAGDPERYVALVALLAIMSGVMLALAGALKLGALSELLARPVLTGFITGLALVIALGQLDRLFGVDATGDNFFQEAWDLLSQLGDTHVETFLVGFGSLALLLGLRAVAHRAPAPLIVVALAIICSAVFDLEAHDVHIVGDIPSGLPPIKGPDIGLRDIEELLPGALALAIVAFAEGIAGVRSIAARHKQEIDANQELIAYGTANVAAGFASSFPVDVSLSRSAVADAAGARSQMYGVICFVATLVTLVALTPLFHDLPEATLGAVVIGAVLHLIDVSAFRRLYYLKRTDFLLAAVCALGVLAFDILPGLIIAVIVSFLALVYHTARPQVARLGRSGPPGQESYVDVERTPDAETTPGVLIIRFDGELYFANARYFREQLQSMLDATDPPARAVVLNAEVIHDLDTTAIDMLVDLGQHLAESGIDLLFARAHGPVRALIRRSELSELISDAQMFPSVRAAVMSVRDD